MKKHFSTSNKWENNKKEALELLPVRQIVLFACDVANLVLPIWEERYPQDERPRKAILAAQNGDAAAYAAHAAAADAAHAAHAAAHAAHAASAHAAAAASYAAADAAYAAAVVRAYAAAPYAAAHHAAASAAAACDASNATAVAVHAAAVHDAADHAASAASQAAYAASKAVICEIYEDAYNGGNVFNAKWRTPLTVEMVKNPDDYHILLDALTDADVPEEILSNLRTAKWRLSNWIVYHLNNDRTR